MSKSQILNNLWVGSWSDAKNIIHLRKWRVITTADDAQVLGHEYYPISDPGTATDDARQLKLAIEATILSLTTYEKTLVHCQSGVNRSVSTVIGTLMLTQGINLEEAYNKIFIVRKMINPCLNLLHMVCDITRQKFPDNFERPVPVLDNAEVVVNATYERILQRKADPGGLDSYATQIRSKSMTITQLEKHLRNSEEYKKRFK